MRDFGLNGLTRSLWPAMDSVSQCPLEQAEEFMLELMVDQIDAMSALGRSETLRA